MIKFADIPRPSLNWMTPNQVLAVRNNIAGLCYPKGQCIDLKHSRAILEPQLTPLIRWVNKSGTSCFAWLKIEGKKLPYWDFCLLNADMCADLQFIINNIVKEPFNSHYCEFAAAKVKEWSKNFPFKPHDGALTNKGEFIA